MQESWDIIEYFERFDNAGLLSALRGGANSLYLHLNRTLSQEAKETLFKNIDFSMIDLYLKGDHQSINSVIGNGIHLILPHGFDQLQNIITESSVEVNIGTISSDSFASQTLEALQKITDLMEQPLNIEYEANANFLQNIIHLRALRLLWAHMEASMKIENASLKIIGIINEKRPFAMEEQVIYETIATMSCVIGSADGISIQTPTDTIDNEAFKRRISRNIHHLLHYESKMNLVNDPLAGSHFIERETTRLAKEIWEKFTA